MANLGNKVASIQIESIIKAGVSSALKDFTLDPRTRRIGLLNSSDFEQVGGYSG